MTPSFNTTALQDLLSQVASNNHIEKTDHNRFNIFSVLGIETREVLICRFIGELLNPNGHHELGSLPLKKFAEIVLEDNTFSDEDAQYADITLEDKIEGDRRVDIVIETGRMIYPIEVKVWAGDQDAQLSDYYHYYFGDRKDRKIYYLTPTGWEASAKSVGDLNKTLIERRSFDVHIRKWLESLNTYECNCRAKSSMKQFKEVIDQMCKNNDEFKELERVLQLADSSQMKGALLLLKYKDELWEKIRLDYLYKYIDLGEDKKYELRDALEEDKKIDSHVLLRVVRKDDPQKPVAWICVETNLYLATEKEKRPNQKWEKYGRDSNYYWMYISPEKSTEIFQLKKLRADLYDEKIEIRKYLDAIDA